MSRPSIVLPGLVLAAALLSACTAEAITAPETTTNAAPTAPADELETTDPTPKPGESEELPADVEALRAFLLDAAQRGDEQLLRTAIDESGRFVSTVDGDPDADHLGYWQMLASGGEDPFARLADVLATTPALTDDGSTWVWPADAALGWRAGIDTDGRWRFFVRGD